MRLLKVLSTDGKKVKRKHPFTEKEKEDLQVNKLYVFLVFIRMDGVEVSSHCSIVHVSFSFLLQSRTVVAENLPDDHSHQNLQKIFSTVGRWISSIQIQPFVYSYELHILEVSLHCENFLIDGWSVNSVKTIRICHPQEPNTSRPKSDFFVSNKVQKQYHTIYIYIYLCCYLKNSEIFSPQVTCASQSSSMHLWNMRHQILLTKLWVNSPITFIFWDAYDSTITPVYLSHLIRLRS